MSIWDSLLTSTFGLGIVFIVLIGLSAFIALESKIFEIFSMKKKAGVSQNPACLTSEEKPLATIGELKLIGVEEKTAAMIMAIVSDESGIPLSELQFKSIKAID